MKKFLAAVILLFSLSAKAGLLLEPYLGYALGSYDNKQKAGATLSSNNGTLTGPTFGARVGYIAMIPFFAIDASMASLNDHSGLAGVSDTTYTNTTLFAVVGAQLPLVSVWAGYGFYDKGAETVTGVDIKTSGNALKAGVGIRPLPLVQFNLEYVMHTLTTVTSAGVDYTATDQYDTQKNNSVILSVSLPLNL